MGGVGDRFTPTGDFRSSSARPAVWQTGEAALEFAAGGPAASHVLEVQGADGGGYVGNFAWGAVAVDAGQSLVLTDGDAFPGGALYVRALDLEGAPRGAALPSFIATHLANAGPDDMINLYYDPSERGQRLLGGPDVRAGQRRRACPGRSGCDVRAGAGARRGGTGDRVRRTETATAAVAAAPTNWWRTMWDFIAALLNGAATGLAGAGAPDKSRQPSFAGKLTVALFVALLAGGCAVLALVPDGWGARVLILLLAALLGLVAFAELWGAVTQRRRLGRARASGFPVTPSPPTGKRR